MTALNPSKPCLRTFAAVAQEVQAGDVLLFRNKKLWGFGGLIKRATGGIHSHAELLCPVDGVMYTCGMVEGIGFRQSRLDQFAAQHPGQLDLFHPVPGIRVNGEQFIYDNNRAARYMLGFGGKKYSWRGILRLAVQKTPGLWFFAGTDVRDDAEKDHRAAFCSHAVAAAMQFGGGLDPVPGCPNARVTPHDLFKSWAIHYGYYGTLTD